MNGVDQLNLSLAGRYSIDRLIGEGGMATVYLARDLKHERLVAVKVLKPDLGAALGVERFLSEIRVTANLQHPNLLPLFDSGVAGALLFYVMPYVEGESLRQRLDRQKQLPIDDAVRIATAIGSALDYAHRHGVIHRDLKPENILLHEGQPLVADFGIALAVSNAGGDRITQTGLSLGTPQYMSPEQATGDRVIDSRSDIYSLGAITYEMLTGEPPHTGATSQAIIARLITERPRGIRVTRPNVSENIEAAVEHALEKIPADRWETAKEFGEALAGTRVVVRPAVSMQFALQQNAQHVAGTSPDVGSVAIATASRIGTREMIAWIVGALAVAVAGLALLARQSPREMPGVAAEFQVELPDSLSLIAVGGTVLALSPDGSTLVFQAARPGQEHALFVRKLAERSVHEIRGTEGATAPSFSSDGSEVLFTRRRGGGGGGGGRGGGEGRTGGRGVGTGPVSGPFGRVPTGGGAARSFGDSSQVNSYLSWGDRNQIVVAFRSRLWTLSPDGTVRTLLADPDSVGEDSRYAFPDVLPGGKAALFIVGTGGAGADTAMIATVTIPDGKVTKLAINGSNPRYSAVGGGHIVFATPDARLMAVRFDVRRLKVVGAPFVVVEGVRVGAAGVASFAVSQNGTLAYVVGAAREGDVTDVTLVAVTRAGVERDLGLAPGKYSHPRVSPDGKQIAVERGTVTGPRGWENPDIWRLDIATTALSRVTTDSVSRVPSWSADGDRIAFTSPEGDTIAKWRPLSSSGQPASLVRAPVRIREVSLGPAHGYATLSVQNGSGGDDRDIWLVHMDSLDRPRAFLNQPYAEYSARVSPDGSLIAYVHRKTGRSEVYVQPILGGVEVQLSVDGGEEPIWAPNSREVFFRGNRLMSAQLVTRPALSMTRLGTVFPLPGAYPRTGPPGFRTTNYDVLPGGNEFVMLKTGLERVSNTNPPIIVMMNWHLRNGGHDR